MNPDSIGLRFTCIADDGATTSTSEIGPYIGVRFDRTPLHGGELVAGPHDARPEYDCGVVTRRVAP